jgi:hypothetical protein
VSVAGKVIAKSVAVPPFGEQGGQTRFGCGQAMEFAPARSINRDLAVTLGIYA